MSLNVTFSAVSLEESEEKVRSLLINAFTDLRENKCVQVLEI